MPASRTLARVAAGSKFAAGRGPPFVDAARRAFAHAACQRGAARRLVVGAAHAAGVPTAILSRQVAVVRGQSLIINLPGQPKAIAETLEGLKADDGSQKVHGIFAAVPYCIDLIGGPYIETHDAVCKAFRPKNAVRAARG